MSEKRKGPPAPVCPKCQAKCFRGSKHCYKCGASLSSSTPEERKETVKVETPHNDGKKQPGYWDDAL